MTGKPLHRDRLIAFLLALPPFWPFVDTRRYLANNRQVPTSSVRDRPALKRAQLERPLLTDRWSEIQTVNNRWVFGFTPIEQKEDLENSNSPLSAKGFLAQWIIVSESEMPYRHVVMNGSGRSTSQGFLEASASRASPQPVAQRKGLEAMRGRSLNRVAATHAHGRSDVGTDYSRASPSTTARHPCSETPTGRI